MNTKLILILMLFYSFLFCGISKLIMVILIVIMSVFMKVMLEFLYDYIDCDCVNYIGCQCLKLGFQNLRILWFFYCLSIL